MSFIKNPSVAIIIVNWNSYLHTSACLTSLKQVTYDNFKIIVVDNGSKDGSDHQLEVTFSDIILLRNKENTGFTGGNNTGIAYALKHEYDYLMLLNNDTEVEADFLMQLVNVMENDFSIGAIQPKFYFLNNKDRVWNTGGKIIKSLGWVKTIRNNNKINLSSEVSQETEWITGCGFLTRTSIIKQIGGLNDRFFIYCEDVDWSLRIQSKGYKLHYCPKAIVYHEAGMSNKNKVQGKEGYLNPIVHYLNTRNNILLLRKYTPWYYAGSVIAFQSAKYTAIIFYFLARRRFVKIKFLFRGLKDGIFSEGI